MEGKIRWREEATDLVEQHTTQLLNDGREFLYHLAALLKLRGDSVAL